MKLTYPTGYDLKINRHIYRYIRKHVEKDDVRLLFTGVPGSGKTLLAEIIFKELFKDIRDDRTLYHYVTIDCRTIYKYYLLLNDRPFSDSSERLYRLLTKHQAKNIILDDVGDERPSTIKSHEFIGGIIEDICDNIERNKTKNVIITTNLNENMLKKFYNLDGIDRVYDRICHYFDIIEFADHSFRKQNIKRIRRPK